MFESDNKLAIDKKAYEIAYALFRIVPKISELSIAQRITEAATGILASSVAEEYKDAAKHLGVIDYLLKLIIDLNIISLINGDLLLKEINSLNLAFGEQLQGQNVAVDIREFLSPMELSPVSLNATPKANQSPSGIVVARPEAKAKIAVQESESGNNTASTFLKSGMRQIAILDKIRQSGNCRLRDILEVLPDTSERTIRYDLEDLVERNLIERIGTGGPSVYYRIRQSA